MTNHKYAKALGREGGKATARNLTAAQRKQRASKAAKARWQKRKKPATK